MSSEINPLASLGMEYIQIGESYLQEAQQEGGSLYNPTDTISPLGGYQPSMTYGAMGSPYGGTTGYPELPSYGATGYPEMPSYGATGYPDMPSYGATGYPAVPSYGEGLGYASSEESSISALANYFLSQEMGGSGAGSMSGEEAALFALLGGNSGCGSGNGNPFESLFPQLEHKIIGSVSGGNDTVVSNIPGFSSTTGASALMQFTSGSGNGDTTLLEDTAADSSAGEFKMVGKLGVDQNGNKDLQSSTMQWGKDGKDKVILNASANGHSQAEVSTDDGKTWNVINGKRTIDGVTIDATENKVKLTSKDGKIGETMTNQNGHIDVTDIHAKIADYGNLTGAVTGQTLSGWSASGSGFSSGGGTSGGGNWL